jgi:hypothetical protein
VALIASSGALVEMASMCTCSSCWGLRRTTAASLTGADADVDDAVSADACASAAGASE